MSETAYAWAPITKTVREDDGTLLVYGPAASSALDRDAQRLDSAWLDQAMPRWMAEGGGVREQHDPKRAVGVGVGLSKGEDGAHLLTARIVDPVAVKKIEHGVLRGFSVGIKGPKVQMGKADAPNGLVVGGDVIEVSVVDRPANPGCTFDLAKADSTGDLVLVEDPQVIEKGDTFGLLPELYERLAAPVKDALAALAAGGATVTAQAEKADAPDEPAPVTVHVTVQGQVATVQELRDAIDKADLSAAGRRKAASSGAAMSDGSYPIESKADLRKAIRAVGRGGADHDKIRKHIVKRAKALGLEAMVPDNWNSDGSLKDAAKADEATIAKAEEVIRDMHALAPGLAKADDGNGGEDESEDIAGAQDAIAAIAKLIIAEAESLAMGNLNELCDIQLLCSAAESLKWFAYREAAEQDGDPDMSLADRTDLDKAATAAGKEGAAADSGDSEDDDSEDDEDDTSGAAAAKKPAAKKTDDGALLTKAEAQAAVQAAVAEALAGLNPQTTPANEPETVTKADLADMVKAAVAEATKAAEERAAALAADVAKASVAEAVKDLPTPGGPVLTRTAAQQSTAAESDAARMRAEGDALMAKAEQFAANRDLAEGYRVRAKALYARAGA